MTRTISNNIYLCYPQSIAFPSPQHPGWCGYKGRPERFPTTLIIPVFTIDGFFPLRNALVAGAEGDEHPTVAHRPSDLVNGTEQENTKKDESGRHFQIKSSFVLRSMGG